MYKLTQVGTESTTEIGYSKQCEAVVKGSVSQMSRKCGGMNESCLLFPETKEEAKVMSPNEFRPDQADSLLNLP